MPSYECTAQNDRPRTPRHLDCAKQDTLIVGQVPAIWCIFPEKIVHISRGRGAHGWHDRVSLFGEVLVLPLELAFDLDGVSDVDVLVTEGIGQSLSEQIIMLFTGVVLRTEDSGDHLISGLYKLAHLTPLGSLRG